ncbi:MAG: hypothetical protein V4671_30390 [Armatimonadota bacterium]
MAHEPAIALQVLQSQLGNDSVLSATIKGIYSSTVPGKALFPYILIVSNGGSDMTTAGGRAYSEPSFLVKVVSVNDQQDKTANVALGRIDELLQGYQAPEGNAFVSIRSFGILPEFVENTSPSTNFFRHAGRYWRVTVSLPSLT